MDKNYIYNVIVKTTKKNHCTKYFRNLIVENYNQKVVITDLKFLNNTQQCKTNKRFSTYVAVCKIEL